MALPYGFNYDQDGFLEVHLQAQLAQEINEHGAVKEVAQFVIWFREGHPSNCLEILSQTGNAALHSANIQGAERLILLVKNEIGYNKVRVVSNSPFLHENAKYWTGNKNYDQQENCNPANWTEIKYSTEIRRICAACKDMSIKWVLVDGTCPGILKAKLIGENVQADYAQIVNVSELKLNY